MKTTNINKKTIPDLRNFVAKNNRSRGAVHLDRKKEMKRNPPKIVHHRLPDGSFINSVPRKLVKLSKI